MTDDRSPKGPKRPTSRRAVTRDEAALFRHVMRDVAPLENDQGKADTKPPSAKTQAAPLSGDAAKKDPLPPSHPLPTLPRGAAVGLDARTMTRLRRGQMRPEATLDLHGMTRDQAHRALSGFLARAQREGRRCIIVITGKGRLSEGGGVLRAELPHWLNLPANRPRILGFTEAQPRDGGAGAVYVLLRRPRPDR